MGMVKNYLKANSSTQKTLLHVLGTRCLGQAFTPAWANSIQQCKMVKNQIKGHLLHGACLVFPCQFKKYQTFLSTQSSLGGSC